VHACRWSASSNRRPGFKAMLDRIAGNGVCCIIVESRASRSRPPDGLWQSLRRECGTDG
jgi:hypothetical protein